jgi:hypothetical protein
MVSAVHMEPNALGTVQHTRPLTAPYTASTSLRPAAVRRELTAATASSTVPLRRASTASGPALRGAAGGMCVYAACQARPPKPSTRCIQPLPAPCGRTGRCMRR